jgi:3-deoxy-manno-octulosonate cytidylyltransferase (CMP-KDO synthetase)
MRSIGIIPVRMESARLPGKALLPIAGRPMVEWVWRRASQAVLLDGVFIATDSRQIAEVAAAFGAPAVITSSNCGCGTERVAEAAERLHSEGIDPVAVVNIQGDEPLIEPQLIDSLVKPLLDREPPEMLTAATVNPELTDLVNPAVCKVVCDCSGKALYFSRSIIPHSQSKTKEHPKEHIYLRHIGIYAYRRDFLSTFAKLVPGPLEKAEMLEMIRALEHGYNIQVVKTKYRSVGVDTQEQLDYVRRVFAEQGLAEKILAGE